MQCYCVNQWGLTRLAALPNIPVGYCNVPTGLSVLASGPNTVFSWVAPHDVLKYELRYRKVGAGVWDLVNVYGQNYAIVLDAASDYEWTVTSYCSISNISTSVAGPNFTTGAYTGVCMAPVSGNMLFEAIGSSVTISWTGTTGISYSIEVRKHGSLLVTAKQTSVPSVVFNTLIPNTLYEIRIKTICTNNQSVWSEWVEFNSGAMGICAPVSGVTSTTSAGGAVVVWAKPMGVQSVTIRLNAAVIVTGYTGTNYSFSGLNPDTSYTVEIISECNGIFGEVVTAVIKTKPTACPPPTELSLLNNQSDQITATWVPAPGVTSQEISINGLPGMVLGPLVTSYVFTLAVTGTVHIIAVRSLCPGSTSSYTNKSLFVPATCLQVTGIAVRQKTDTTVTFDWEPKTSATSYKVRLYKLSDNSLIEEKSTTDSFITFSGLAAATAYYVRFITVCGLSETSMTTAFNVTTNALPPCPVPIIESVTLITPTTCRVTFKASDTYFTGNFVIEVIVGLVTIVSLPVFAVGFYDLIGLTPGETTIIRVKNVGYGDECIDSFDDQTITVPDVCLSPISPSASFTTVDNLQIVFTTVAGAAFYRFYIIDVLNVEQIFTSLGSPANIALPEGDYLITMETVCDIEGVNSNRISVPLGCPAPKDIVAVYTSRGIEVDWRPQVGGTVVLDFVGLGNSLVVEVPNAHFYRFSNPMPNSVYTLYVYTRCENGDSSIVEVGPIVTGNFNVSDGFTSSPGNPTNPGLPVSELPEEELPIVFEAMENETDPTLVDCVPIPVCPPGSQSLTVPCTGQTNCGCGCSGSGSSASNVEAGSNIYIENLTNGYRIHSVSPTVTHISYTHVGVEASVVPLPGIRGMGIIGVIKYPDSIRHILTGTPAVDQVLVNRVSEQLEFGSPIQDGEEISVIIRGIIYSNQTTGALPPSIAALFVFGEVPVGVLNNVNTAFTTEFNFDPNTLNVYVNGVSQAKGADFIPFGANAIIFTVPPEPGDILEVDYMKIV